jgi:hypothetical protein
MQGKPYAAGILIKQQWLIEQMFAERIKECIVILQPNELN